MESNQLTHQVSVRLGYHGIVIAFVPTGYLPAMQQEGAAG